MVAFERESHERTDAERLLRTRVGWFALLGLGLAALALVLDAAYGVAIARRPWVEPFSDFAWPIASVAALFVAAYVSSRVFKHAVILRLVDAVTAIAGCAAQAWMVTINPRVDGTEAWGVVGIVMVLMARAIVVPSTGIRTFVIGLLGSAPLVPTIYITLSRLAPDGSVATARQSVGTAVTFIVLALALQTATSRILFGLRRELREARRLGRYTLKEKLGEGGMGAVYRAQHAMLRRPTALKLLPRDKASAKAVARFEREVQLASELRNPHAVAIFDYGRADDGTFYYAMEYLNGVDLKRLVEMEGPQPEARVVHILMQVCEVLEEAHDRGLIHRDVKPANIILTQRGAIEDFVTVLDFGLVKDLTDQDAAMTEAEALLGTPLFLPPEAIEDPTLIGPQSDLYAVGCVAYWLLTGTPVFTGMTVYEVCAKHVHDPPEPPSKRAPAAVSPELEAIVLQCLEKKIEDRPPSAAALKERLGELAQQRRQAQCTSRER